MTIIKDSNEGISEDIVTKFEHKWNVKLPIEYKRFLIKYNGGYPSPDAFAIKEIEDESTVDKFLSLESGPHSNLDSYVNTYIGRIPKDLLPIAHDPGGNLICIGIKGENFGIIYFWDHEFESDDNDPDYSNVHFVANNFDEFLKELYELEDD
ncbi:MAG: SMI1/KNR4 family protein [Proteobacteria bacterium]|nr:SMI1/KNR4 family protein [Pseudomonadota bacterium]